MYYNIMARDASDSNTKTSGRPPVEKPRDVVSMRWNVDELAKIDAYAAKHGIKRSAAIRRLVELGLKKR